MRAPQRHACVPSALVTYRRKSLPCALSSCATWGTGLRERGQEAGVLAGTPSTEPALARHPAPTFCIACHRRSTAPGMTSRAQVFSLACTSLESTHRRPCARVAAMLACGRGVVAAAGGGERWERAAAGSIERWRSAVADEHTWPIHTQLLTSRDEAGERECPLDRRQPPLAAPPVVRWDGSGPRCGLGGGCGVCESACGGAARSHIWRGEAARTSNDQVWGERLVVGESRARDGQWL